MLALVLARAGDLEQAQQLADSLDAAFPLDTSIHYYCLPTIRAAMRLQANDPAGAVEILRRTEGTSWQIPIRSPCFTRVPSRPRLSADA